jgi:hypothetical protein
MESLVDTNGRERPWNDALVTADFTAYGNQGKRVL